MELILSNTSKEPIYAQIKRQIQDQILGGLLESEVLLPSIRRLARDLGVSIITVKRAYDELEQEGYIHTMLGKGSYVAGQSLERIREKKRQITEDRLSEVIREMQQLGMDRRAFDMTVSLLWEEE